MKRLPAISGTVISIAALLALALLTGCGGTSTTSTASQPSAGAVPDWTNYGYAVVGSKNLTPGQADSVSAGSLTVQVPANAFSSPVKFEILTLSDMSSLQSQLPNATPIVAFAFRVTDLNTGQLIGNFNNPTMVAAKDPGITAQSAYYNIDVNGNVTLNPSGTQASAGELDHPESGAAVAWVIATPNAGGTGTSGTTTGGGGGTAAPSPYGY